MAKEQREVRADNIDFGQHPENNQILDGDEACEVFIFSFCCFVLV